MTTHNVADAKAHLSQLLDAALKGEEVIVARAGKPLVRLVPVNTPAARVLGFLDLPSPVSAATAWEMAIKHRAGKWPEADILLAQHDDLTSRLGAQSLDISAADAIRAGSLDWNHADPFDRMLAAQALLRQAALVTRDAAFGHLRGLSTIW